MGGRVPSTGRIRPHLQRWVVTLVLSYVLSSGCQHLWGRGSYSRKLQEHLKGIRLPVCLPSAPGSQLQRSLGWAGGGAGTGTNLAPTLTPARAAVLCQDGHFRTTWWVKLGNGSRIKISLIWLIESYLRGLGQESGARGGEDGRSSLW